MQNSIVPFDSQPQGVAAAGGAQLAAADHDAGWGSAQESQSTDQGARFRRYWAAIKRFWWLVASLTAIGTAAGLVATRYVDPVYMAQGGVLITDLGARSTEGQFKNPILLPAGAWTDLFKTYTVVEEVVARQRLWYTAKSWQDSVALDGIRPTFRVGNGDYTYTLDTLGRYKLTEAKAGVVEQGVFGDTVGRKAGFIWLPTQAGLMGRRWVGFRTRAIRPIAENLRNNLDIKIQDASNLVRPTFTWPEQRPAADILNAWMQAFKDKAAELRLSSLGMTADRLQAQRATALESVREAQNALQGFRTRTIVGPSEGSSAAVSAAGAGTGELLASEYAQAQRNYEVLKNDREALEAIAKNTSAPLDYVSAIPSAQLFPSLMNAVAEVVKREGDLRTMRQQGLLDSLRTVRDAANMVQTLRTQTIPNLASEAAAVLRTRENTLLRTMRSDSSKLVRIPAQSIEESTLRRDLSVAENLYLRLESEYEAKRLATLNTTEDVTIIDRALPTSRPTRNVILFLIVGGVLGSLVLGVMIALLLDAFDHRFRYPEQITHELRLEVIGALPAVPPPSESAKNPEAMLQSVEAFRGLRMNLHHAFDAPPVLVTVTSPGAGDGKSMVSSNLALSFAEAGYRTLVIDGDIRRGKLHSVFNIDRRPGLLDYLAGEVELSAVLRDVPLHNRLSIIASGTRRHRGPELLTSARFMALINAVRPRFDAIIVDSAPLAAGIDAYALGAATGNMILVMRTGLTDRRVARAKLKVAERLPINIIGAVVNAVPAAGLYSEYSYLYGYDADDETDLRPAGSAPIAVLQPTEVGRS
jgi:succinoglycan biosynthesis transport protein ExoP